MIPDLHFSPAAADARHLWREYLDLPHLYSRQEEFYRLVHDVSGGLQALCHSQSRVLLLTSAGTGALECAIAALPLDKRILVVNTGYFGQRLSEIARLHFAQVAHFDLPFGQALTEEHETALTEAIQASRPDAIAVVHLETSSTLVNDVAMVAQLARQHGALTIVDGISAVGSVAVRLNDWGVNCYVASGYKALACPVGLSFILADELFQTQAQRRWSYTFDFDRLTKAAHDDHFLWSPNVLNLHCLKRAIDRIMALGQDEYFRQLEAQAAQFRGWLMKAELHVFGDPRCLSPCFTAVQLKEPRADQWLACLKEDYRIVIGKGLGEGADYFLRIGHYPVHMFEQLRVLAEAMGEIMLLHPPENGKRTTWII